jgi:hypothetical protein
VRKRRDELFQSEGIATFNANDLNEFKIARTTETINKSSFANMRATNKATKGCVKTGKVNCIVHFIKLKWNKLNFTVLVSLQRGNALLATKQLSHKV